MYGSLCLICFQVNNLTPNSIYHLETWCCNSAGCSHHVKYTTATLQDSPVIIGSLRVIWIKGSAVKLDMPRVLAGDSKMQVESHIL